MELWQKNTALALSIQVRWRILGPNTAQPLEETNDVSYFTPEGLETTTGFLEWENGQGGEKTFTLIVKPHNGWEIQKEFLISIYDITGFPISDGNGQVHPETGEMTLTVSFGLLIVDCFLPKLSYHYCAW